LATGVAVARPVALIERGRGLGVQHSCLVTRELEGWVPLGEWLESHSGADRKLGLTSVGACLARVFHARAWFPRLALDDLLVEDRPLTESVEARDDVCASRACPRLHWGACPEAAWSRASRPAGACNCSNGCATRRTNARA
jgi:hypothetical protein